MKKILLGGVAAAALCSASAFAADMPVKAPLVAAAPFSWTGFYFGVNGGFGWGRTPYDWPLDGDVSGSFAPAVGGSFRQKFDGGVAGGHIGYNSRLFSNWILGFEASIDWSDIKGSSGDQFAGIGAGASYNSRLNWFATATTRIGYAQDNWLVYSRFGTAAGEMRTRLFNSGNGFTTGQDKDHIGWTIGGGIEYAITRNWVLGLEYNYYDLGRQTYGGNITLGGVPTGNPNEYHLDPKFSTVLARLSYKLDEPGAPAAMPVKAPMRSAAVWQGSYLGINGGYGWGNTRWTFPPRGGGVASVAPVTGASFDEHIKGGLGGIHSGYNYQMGNWVFGLEGSLDWSGIKGSSTNALLAAGADVGATYNEKLKWLTTVTPRLGVAMDSWLLYAKGGLAAGRMQTRLANPLSPAPALPYADGQKNDHIGWTVGVGVDYAWAPNWIVGVEYNYYDLGDQRYGGVPTFGGVPLAVANEYHLDPKFSTVLARLTYKFGH